MSHPPGWRATVAIALLIGAVIGDLAGCCGTDPSHQCNFTPAPNHKDAGTRPDALPPCGSMVCSDTQICCVTTMPPNATCIDLDLMKFQQLGCALPPSLPCMRNDDCPGGTVCCLFDTIIQKLSCTPPTFCSAALMGYRVCETDMDCPGSGVCMSVGTGAGGPTDLSLCF